jgi:hypothetical protein
MTGAPVVFGRRAVLMGGAAAILAGCATPGALATTSSASAAELTARLEDIRSVREIKRLQHLWGHYADAGQWSDMAALFTDAGVWTDGATTVSSRNEVHALLRRTMGGVPMAWPRTGLTFACSFPP